MRFTAWLVLLATLAPGELDRRARGARRHRARHRHRRPPHHRARDLLPFAARGLRAKLPGLSRRDWKVLAGLGFTGGGLHLGCSGFGLHYTTATSGILYLSMTPIFILILAAPLGERTGLRSGSASRSRSAASISSPRRAGPPCRRSTSAT